MRVICQIRIRDIGPDKVNHTLILRFYHADVVGPGRTGSSPILTVEHISILCVHVYAGFSEIPSAAGDSPTGGMQNVIAYPWEDIVGICAGQERFMRLQLRFRSHVHLAQFMQAQRATLSKLNGRIGLFYYQSKSRCTVAADFETLRELPGGTAVLFVWPRYYSLTGH